MVQPLKAVSVPPTVHVVLTARIDRLPDREKALLQIASVIGRRFSEEVLKKVAGLSETDVATALAMLDRRDFVHQVSLYPEVEWAFKHPLTQEAAYRSQLSERRRELHAVVARAIHDSFPDKLDHRASELAYHWEQAGEVVEAAQWHLRAARLTDRNRSQVEVARHLRKVHELAQKAAGSCEAADLDLSACLGLLNLAQLIRFTAEEARAVYSAGTNLAVRREDLGALARLNAFYATTLANHGLAEESVRYGEEAVALAERLEDPWLKLWISLDSLRACFWTGRLQRLLSIAEAGLELSEALGQTPAPTGYPPSGVFRAWMSFWKGEGLYRLGRLKESEGWFDRAIAFGRETDHFLLLAACHEQAAGLSASLGDVGAMLAHAREAVQAADSPSAGWPSRSSLSETAIRHWRRLARRRTPRDDSRLSSLNFSSQFTLPGFSSRHADSAPERRSSRLCKRRQQWRKKWAPESTSPSCSLSGRGWLVCWVTRTATAASSPKPEGSSPRWAQPSARRWWGKKPIFL